MAETTLTIQIEDSFKQSVELHYQKRGLDLSEVIKNFLIKDIEDESLIYNDVPKWSVEQEALCYSPENMKYVMEGISQAEDGELIEMTLEGLEDLAK